uniref:Uncharacterized protein n=1 Tax=Panagrolaimus superbus TaxID=310955 RepID=A0A914YAK4_9BILA
MQISKNFYDQCCPSYKKAIDELEIKLAHIERKYNEDEDDVYFDYMCDESNYQKVSAIFQFSRFYLTPNAYWEECISNSLVIQNGRWEDPYHVSIKKAFKHFHFHEEEENQSQYMSTISGIKLIDFYKSNALNDNSCDIIDEDDLQYPHNCLKQCFRYFEMKTTRIPSKKLIKIYQEMQQLYSKIKAVENNFEEWFNLLCEFGDVVFIKQNVEYRIGKNLLDVKLWKHYLAFLKEQKDYEGLLETYSKYCRFFLDDKEMLKEFRESMVEHGYADLSLDEILNFQAKEESEEDAADDDDEKEDHSQSKDDLGNENHGDEDSGTISYVGEIVSSFNKTICSTFYDTYHIQDFALPKPFIRNILENANHRVLRKLFFSCKYFFVNKSTPICYRLHTGIKELYEEESLKLSHCSNYELLSNTFITGSIHIDFPQNHKNAFISNVIPHLYRCEAKFIILKHQNLSFNDLKFLIQHGGVIDLQVDKCQIKDENGEEVLLEEILKYLPNIEELLLPIVKINANINYALSNQTFNNIFCKFRFAKSDCEYYNFDFSSDLQFKMINGDQTHLKCFLKLSKKYDADFVEKFKKILYGYDDSCENLSVIASLWIY